MSIEILLGSLNKCPHKEPSTAVLRLCPIDGQRQDLGHVSRTAIKSVRAVLSARLSSSASTLPWSKQPAL